MTEPFCDLDMLSGKARQQYYKRLWSNDEVPIEAIRCPLLLQEYPHFAEEITTAYLFHTTFTFEVWINYDTAVGKLYTDKRADDCGKIILTRAAMRCLGRAELDGIELPRVRLDIGTPFKPLFEIHLNIVPTTPELGKLGRVGMLSFAKSNHPNLTTYVTEVADSIAHARRRLPRHGFTFRDLEHITKCFRALPDPSGSFPQMDTNFGQWSPRHYRGDWAEIGPDKWSIDLNKTDFKRIAGLD